MLSHPLVVRGEKISALPDSLLCADQLESGVTSPCEPSEDIGVSKMLGVSMVSDAALCACVIYAWHLLGHPADSGRAAAYKLGFPG